ncbi:uncharacterized protein LY89DRAFT_673249 [Mollisia scopiformis]|uniref:Zn(2)-C6 fungal-type domain-containing protein n=1 Tax=Mollisia scopiformis TaxID=149040 RepID=A0A194WX38_MOLSC|nr:uncharacterized protein LY89DRAFT_673249 [Mollisia scopiformis]KUJ12249.1 hypothetical protein LY89DRAFT_673249 [Mollisia scopiformis]
MLSESAAPIAQLVPRRQHKKSRTGCLPCKIRKVKCDERRPLCQNCARHYKDIEKCDFPPAPAATESTLPDRLPPRTRPISKKSPTSFRRAPKYLLPLFPGSGIDPFECFPSCNVPEAQKFMHHYFQNFVSKSFPVHLDHIAQPIMQSFWSLASDDIVLFHATLQLSALDLEVLRGGDNEAAQAKFLLNKECITLLRKRVEDSILGISDQTIASVLFIIIVEFQRSNFKMVTMHIQGLKRMVALRGGLHTIRSTNHMLANLIFGISLTVTTELQFFPETPLEPLASDDPIELAHEPHLAQDPRLFRLDNVGLSRDHVQVFKVLRYNTNRADIEWPDNAAPTKCSDIMARMMALPIPVDEGPVIASISESSRLAGVGLCCLPWKHDYPSPELMINTMIHKLRISLETVLNLVPSDHPLLPWLLSVGGIYSVQPERNWFVGHLVPVVVALQIRSWEDMRPHLTKLWEEVEAKRKDLDLVDLDVWQ